MITTGAASDATYKKGYTHVYQTYTPASRYLTGAADLLDDALPADHDDTTVIGVGDHDRAVRQQVGIVGRVKISGS